MKQRNGKKKGVTRMPLALWISIGAVILCAVTAKHYQKR